MTAFLITPEYDRSRGDTVVGPGKSSSEWKSADILDLLFQNESSTSSNREGFEDTLQAMKLGLSGVTEYARQAEGEPERLSVLAYRPVYARTYQALSPDDFARGVNVSRSLVYTVAISAWDEKLRRPFLDIEEEVFDNLEHLRTLYIALVAVISALLAMYACLVSHEFNVKSYTVMSAVSHNVLSLHLL